MSAALSLTSSPPESPPPVVTPQAYVTAEEAAQALDMSSRHVRRLCESELQRRGLAVSAMLPELGDKKPRWYVARSYDLRLARGQAGVKFQLPDLSGFTEQQETLAWQRAACVQVLREARRHWSGRQQDWLPTLCAKLRERYPDLKISPSTLRGWFRIYRTPADLLQLIDTRGGNQKGQADPAAWDFFKKRYLDERQPTIRVCWEHTRDEARHNGWTWTSYKQCARLLNRKIPPEMQAKFRELKVYRGKFAPYLQQDEDAWEANQCWVGDHTTLDLWCRAGEHIFRPVLTAWMDRRTRRLVGWVLSQVPNSSTITSALRRGIVDPDGMGPPTSVWIDNGKDYDCYSLHGQTKKQRQSKRASRIDEDRMAGVLGLLGIEAHWSIPYNPNGKSELERWFGTLHDRFDRNFPTYCGKDQQHKPESLNQLLRDQRRLIPTFAHVQERLGQFVAGYNANADTGSRYLLIDGVRLSPDQAMAQLCPQKRVMKDAQALDQLMATWHKPVTVGRNGVTIQIAGKAVSFGQYDPYLVEFKGTGRKVHVAYDPEDMRTIRVHDEQWRFICEARSNYIGNAANPTKLADLKQAMADKARYTRAKKEIAKGAHNEYLADEEIAAEIAARKRRQGGTPSPSGDNPPPLKVIQTPLDDQSNKVPKPLRKAAGAEHDEPARPRYAMLRAFAQQADQEEAEQDDTTGCLPSITIFNTIFEEEGGTP